MNTSFVQIAWVVFFGGSAVIWAVSAALTGYYRDRQKEFFDLSLENFLKKLPASTPTITTKDFLVGLISRSLKLSSDPDLIKLFEEYRGRAMAALMSAVWLNVFAMLLELGKKYEFVSKAVEPVPEWLCIASILQTVFWTLWALHAYGQFELRHAVKSLALWDEIKAALKGDAKK